MEDGLRHGRVRICQLVLGGADPRRGGTAGADPPRLLPYVAGHSFHRFGADGPGAGVSDAHARRDPGQLVVVDLRAGGVAEQVTVGGVVSLV